MGGKKNPSTHTKTNDTLKYLHFHLAGEVYHTKLSVKEP